MLKQSSRLKQGGIVDRGKTLRFSFDGTEYSGHPGDTLASALLANGVKLVGRSFKYHRPRGIYTAGPEEPNALVEMRSGTRLEPNTKATTVELYDGLEAASQNRWPSLKFDLLSINSLFSPFFGAGFYYKTFMWPASFWERVYEPMIRSSAGLGRASLKSDPDHYEKAFAHCDVLVIGSGPAGLMAALAVGRAGARVILAEEDFRFGGRLLSETLSIGGQTGLDWAGEVLSELESLDTVRLMPRTSIYGVYDSGTYGAVERVSDAQPVPQVHSPRQRSWRIVAKRAVLASGAIERGIAFPGNDLPGIMLGSAIRTYLTRFGVVPGKRAVIFTSSDDGLETARALAANGVTVAALVDTRKDWKHDGRLPCPVYSSAVVERAKGGRTLRNVIIRHGDGQSTEIACDLLAVSNGWNPLLHLTTHLGGRPAWDERLQAFIPGTLPNGMSVAGAAAGHLTLAEALEDGARLGAEAAKQLGFDAPTSELPSANSEATAEAMPLWRVGASKSFAFVDLQNDVTTKDIELARREGFGASEHVKRYTTLGMGTDQGKTANVTALGVLAEITGRAIPDLGPTGFRPPYTPVNWGALAGHHRGQDFRPKRLPPSHGWAIENGAVFAEAGPWLRAQWYQLSDETSWQQSVSREAAAVRRSVGVCDVSTLGKIDIQGPDAASFLDRVYVNKFSTLKVGRARYGLMLREDGFAMDDGTTSRLGEHHFIMTTTTANAGKVMQHLEFCRQVLWPELDLRMVSVSDQWAQYSIAGPRARDVLVKLVDAPFDLSNEGFPRMAAVELTICGGVPARLFRVSYSGELAYEIAVPSRYGDAAIRALMEAGVEFDITPYGTEALNVLRIEKGHVAGPEINGQNTARDLGLASMMADKDCIGRVLAGRPALLEPNRPIFIGVRPFDTSAQLSAGAHFIPNDASAKAPNDEGYVTSVAFSPELGHDIGLGFLKRGQQRIGDHVRAVDLLRGTDVECVICSPVFVDAEGERQRG
jgi:sarcosine oxidase subunit alpha